MSASLDAIIKRSLSGFRPTTLLFVSEWSDKNRILSSVTSGEPGPWRTSRVPYLKEIMDCLSPSSPVRRVVFMKAAQLGGTEVGLNWVGFVIHHAPGPMLMVLPVLETAKRNSRQRIYPLIESTKVLKDLVRDSRSRDSGNTLLSKDFPGGILVMTGANSAVGLRSMPAKYLFLDEIDGYPLDADGEGDPVALAVKRTVTFTNHKIFMVSTPTIKDFSRIEAAYEESDRRRYWVPCPECGEFQTLVWPQISWADGDRKNAFYRCIACDAHIQNHYKMQMITNGKWIAEVPGKGLPAGFHLSSLYSPWMPWGDIAEEHGQVYKDPPRLQTWVNTNLGETWDDGANVADSVGIMGRRELFGPLLPPEVVVITAGIDVQDSRLELEIVGWGKNNESWSIAYHVLWGDPSGVQVWKDLDRILLGAFPHARTVPDLHIQAAAIDSAGHFTDEVYSFVRSRQKRRVWAIKGQGGMGVAVWPKRASLNNKGRIPLFSVGVDACKEAFYARLKVDQPGPGYCHFPHDRDDEWFRQLTAEKMITKYIKGRPHREWIKRAHERNEALDCRVYAIAARQGLVTMGLQIDAEAARLECIPMKDNGNINAKTMANTQPAQREVFTSPWMQS